jgi:hypothetical protein
MHFLPKAVWAGELIKNDCERQSPCRRERTGEIPMKTGDVEVAPAGNAEKLAMPWPGMVMAWPMAD